MSARAWTAAQSAIYFEAISAGTTKRKVMS